MTPRRSLATLILGVCTVLGAFHAKAADRIGVRTLTITTHEPGRVLETLVLYPTTGAGAETLIGDNAMFVGTPAERDAPIGSGRHPLIVVSHGSGGNAAGLGWLTTRLAAMGYIVAVPNHPGSTSGDSSEKKTVELWHRPSDLSAMVDALLADPDYADAVDKTAIGAIGFSLGGYDVLALAGAEQRRADFANFCERNRTMMGCDWLRRGGVDLSALDPRFDDDHRDSRIKAVVAIDPAFAGSYAEDSLKAVKVPVQFINLGTPATTPGIVEAHYLAETISGARLARVPDAVHLSFLGLCKPGAPALIAATGEEPLCTDGGGRDRAALHEDILGIVAAFLRDVLPVAH